jgi:hypothetical protein
VIGPRIHLLLQIAAWMIIAIAPITVAVTVGEALKSEIYPPGGELRFILSLIYGAAVPMVQGGVLLVLLSIDKRIQNRGA